MSPVETYLLDLRAALSDRLPPALTEARLREARAHLIASSEEVGESKAIHRYGRARNVANGLVRSHRRYDTKSTWQLALPLAASYVLIGTLLAFLPFVRQAVGHNDILLPMLVMVGRSAIFLIWFMARVIQTRRWLVGPMLAAQGASLVLAWLILQNIYPNPVSSSFGTDILIGWARAGVFWLLLNALAIGLGRLFDRRPIRATKGLR